MNKQSLERAKIINDNLTDLKGLLSSTFHVRTDNGTKLEANYRVLNPNSAGFDKQAYDELMNINNIIDLIMKAYLDKTIKRLEKEFENL